MSEMFGPIIRAPLVREIRQRRLMLARVSGPGIADQEIVIRNISKRGLGAATQGVKPMMGDRLSVSLQDGQKIDGIVRWQDGPCFGLGLVVELDASAQEEVRQKSRMPSQEPAWQVSRLHRVINPSTDASKLRRV